MCSAICSCFGLGRVKKIKSFFLEFIINTLYYFFTIPIRQAYCYYFFLYKFLKKLKEFFEILPKTIIFLICAGIFNFDSNILPGNFFKFLFIILEKLPSGQ